MIRYSCVVLGILCLLLLFFTLPETPDPFRYFGCKMCSARDPYLPLIGAGYFAVLIAMTLLFPMFPSPLLARSGLVWAIGLGCSLTYLYWPTWCMACLITHACHIAMWLIWIVTPSDNNMRYTSRFKERVYMAIFAPISVAALFSCLNLTFLVYGIKIQEPPVASLQPGDSLPGLNTYFSPQASESWVINFVSPNCPYCKEQLPLMNSIVQKTTQSTYRFINITPLLTDELVAYAPNTEWVEDRDNTLRKLFKVPGFPMLFVIHDDIISDIIVGVPEKFSDKLIAHLD